MKAIFLFGPFPEEKKSIASSSDLKRFFSPVIVVGSKLISGRVEP